MSIYQTVNEIMKVSNGYIIKSEDNINCGGYEETHIFKDFREVIEFLYIHFQERKKD